MQSKMVNREIGLINDLIIEGVGRAAVFILAFPPVCLWGVGVSTALGENLNDEDLALVRSVRVSVLDEVKDGCLPFPDALKVEAELNLRQAGIRIISETDHKAGGYVLSVNPIGFGIEHVDGTSTGECVAYLELTLWRAVWHEKQSMPMISFSFESGQLIYRPPESRMQDALVSATTEMTRKLANGILKAWQAAEPAR